MLKVYFCEGSQLSDISQVFNFTKEFHWEYDGLQILLCNYYLVDKFDDDNVRNAILKLKKWDGNSVTDKIHRITISNGDIFNVDKRFYIYINSRLYLIPDYLYDRLLLNDE